MWRFLTALRYTFIVAGVTRSERYVAKRRRVSSDEGKILWYGVKWW